MSFVSLSRKANCKRLSLTVTSWLVSKELLPKKCIECSIGENEEAFFIGDGLVGEANSFFSMFNRHYFLSLASTNCCASSMRVNWKTCILGHLKGDAAVDGASVELCTHQYVGGSASVSYLNVLDCR